MKKLINVDGSSIRQGSNYTNGITTDTYNAMRSIAEHEQPEAGERVHVCKIGRKCGKEYLYSYDNDVITLSEYNVACRVVDAAEKVEKTEKPAPAKAEGNNGGDAIASALAALQQAITTSQQANAAGVDADAVAAIVNDMLTARLADMREANNVRIITAAKPEGVKVEGFRHPAYYDTMLCAANNIDVYLHGPAGTGKSTIAQQVAEALNIEYYYTSAVMLKSELEGFVDAKGEYVATAFYNAVKNGGLFCFDEVDQTDAEVMKAFNTFLAQRIYCFPNGEKVQAHKDFKVICCANTIGRGASSENVSAYQLDSSTLDRFAFLKVDYCEAFDAFICGLPVENKPKKYNANNEDITANDIFEYVRDLRQALAASGCSYTVSARGINRLRTLLAAGMTVRDAKNAAFFSGWELQDVISITSRITRKESNRLY